MDAEVFQFTTSHGGRPYVPFMVLYTNCLSIHDLTRRSTVLAVSALAVPLPFNSRPHTEVDSLHLYYSIYTYLSIHDLTRRSTVAHNAIRKCINLSIHDLTRRSTHLQSGCASENQLSNSRPHTEVDLFCQSTHFSAFFFQFTTSHGGRPFSGSRSMFTTAFQFTTSHGGRRPDAYGSNI